MPSIVSKCWDFVLPYQFYWNFLYIFLLHTVLIILIIFLSFFFYVISSYHGPFPWFTTWSDDQYTTLQVEKCYQSLVFRDHSCHHDYVSTHLKEKVCTDTTKIKSISESPSSQHLEFDSNWKGLELHSKRTVWLLLRIQN